MNLVKLAYKWMSAACTDSTTDWKSQVEVITVMWVEEQTAIYWSSQQCGLWAERNNSRTQTWNYFFITQLIHALEKVIILTCTNY